jgi:hypothetical protein
VTAGPRLRPPLVLMAAEVGLFEGYQFGAGTPVSGWFLRPLRRRDRPAGERIVCGAADAVRPHRAVRFAVVGKVFTRSNTIESL